MSIRISFEEGRQTIESYYEYIFTAANDIISDSMKKDCLDILQQHPWEHLKNYLKSCYGQMMDALLPQLYQELETFVDSDGGFIHFARNTLNSEEAVEFARHVTDRLLECPDYYLGRTEQYLDAMTAFSTEHAAFEESAVSDRLTEMFQKGITRSEEQRSNFGNQIENEVEENQFVTPLFAVPEILFGLISAWYNSMLNSVPMFMDGAHQLIQSSTDATKAYSSTIGQQVQSQAQTINHSVES